MMSQVRTHSEIIDIMDEVFNSDTADLVEVIGRLVEFEKSLSDNLLIHFKMMVGDDLKKKVSTMAAASVNHATRLEKVVLD